MVVSAITLFGVETPHKQVLVFRNTGEVNLLYADSIKSITLENNDSLGMCQVFTTHGEHRMAVPVSEIDSVAFGSRNTMEMQRDVKVLKDDVDIPYITSFDGEIVKYKSNTPASVLPKAGERLYYGQLTGLFPVGVCAKTIAVNRVADGYDVRIETVDPSEVFSKLFFAGDSTDSEVMQASRMMSRSKFENSVELSVSQDCIDANVGADIILDNVVVDVIRGFYHANCIIKPKVGLTITMKSEDSSTFEKNFAEKTVSLSPICGILIPSFDFSVFLKIEASLSFKYNLRRQFTLAYEWTRKGKTNTFSAPAIPQSEEDVNEASMEILLDGTVFAGLDCAARFGLIGDLGGAGVKLQVGPRFKGEIGMGLIQNLAKDYSPEPYAKGKISVSLGLDYGSFLYYKKLNQLFGDEYETVDLPFKGRNDVFVKSLNLFPEFERTSCVSAAKNTVVSKTVVNEPVEYPLNVGFALEDSSESEESESEPLCIVFQPEMLDSGNDEAVGFVQDFNLDEMAPGVKPKEGFVVRPVFKYNDLTLKAAPASAGENKFYSYFTEMAADKTKIVGGAFDVRSKTSGEKGVLIGNYFPRIKTDSVFSFMGGSGIVADTEAIGNQLTGIWTGKIADEDVILEFRNNNTGCCNGCDFTYSINAPQAGDIKIKYDDGARQNVTYTLVDLAANQLLLKQKGKSTTYTLTSK